MVIEEWQKKCFYAAIGVAMLVIVFLTAISVAAPYLVKESCILEAGRELTVDKVIENPIIRFVSSVQVKPNEKKIGKQEATIRVGVQSVTTEVTVRDRIPPKVTLREVSVLCGNPCKIEAFVVEIEDATETILEYVKEPSFSTEGIQKVKIRVRDKAGNETVAETKLIVVGR